MLGSSQAGLSQRNLVRKRPPFQRVHGIRWCSHAFRRCSFSAKSDYAAHMLAARYVRVAHTIPGAIIDLGSGGVCAGAVRLDAAWFEHSRDHPTSMSYPREYYSFGPARSIKTARRACLAVLRLDASNRFLDADFGRYRGAAAPDCPRRPRRCARFGCGSGETLLLLQRLG